MAMANEVGVNRIPIMFGDRPIWKSAGLKAWAMDWKQCWGPATVAFGGGFCTEKIEKTKYSRAKFHGLVEGRIYRNKNYPQLWGFCFNKSAISGRSEAAGLNCRSWAASKSLSADPRTQPLWSALTRLHCMCCVLEASRGHRRAGGWTYGLTELPPRCGYLWEFLWAKWC